MKFLVFAASLRKDSFNKKLALLTKNILEQQGHEVDYAAFAEFDTPLYNQDVQDLQGFPEGIQNFVTRLKASDALIIASPEYNFSIPGTLKNLIDWVSRIQPMPWRRSLIMLMSASPSLVGGNRGLWQTRIPLEACGAHVFPDMFSLASSHEAFQENDQLRDTNLQERLAKQLQEFAETAKNLR